MVTNRPNKPRPVTARRSRWLIFVWVADILIVLAILAAFVRNPFEFTTLNNLYHLGQKKEWQQVYDRLDKIPDSYRKNEKYPVIRLETLLHLSRNADAIDFIQSQKAIMNSDTRRAFTFQQLAAFAYILVGRDQDAATIFARQPRNPLSQEMLSLIRDTNAERPLDTNRISQVMAVVEDSMNYPDLYCTVVQYLFGRGHLRENELPEAAQLLGNSCERYPYEFVFQRDLAIVQMEMGRIDLSVIHLIIASHLLNNKNFYRPSESELMNFQRAVFTRALRHAESRSASEFWRLMRCIKNILPSPEVTKNLRINPHPLALSELWEWSRFGLEYEPDRWVRETSPTLAVRDSSILAAFETITKNPPKSPLLLPISMDRSNPATNSLEVIPINSEITGLVQDGDNASFTIPFTTGTAEAAVLLCEVRGSLRQGVPGGCEIQLGIDKYYLSPSEKTKWYAFALPLLTPNPVPLRFEFNSDFVAGYTGKEDKDDRNLYVQNILACFLKKQ